MSPTPSTRSRATLTWYKSGWGGQHEFQTGFMLQPNNRNQNDTTYPNGGQNLQDGVMKDVNNPSAGYTIFHKRQFAVDSITTSSVKAQDYSFYVQDTWKPVPRLSLSLGVRADKIKTEDMIFDVTVQDSWNIGPRMGATYRLTADGKNVLRGSYSDRARPAAGDSHLDGRQHAPRRRPTTTTTTSTACSSRRSSRRGSTALNQSADRSIRTSTSRSSGKA